MHELSYQLKRAHLSAVAIGRRLFRGTTRRDGEEHAGVPDMTPARFDILYLVLGRKRAGDSQSPGRIFMADLVRTLGVSRATISKAVKRLVQLGLVTCTHPPTNRRSKVVAVTPEGTARIKQALALVFSGRALAKHYCAFAMKRIVPSDRNRTGITLEITSMWNDLWSLAQHLFDRSESLYHLMRPC